MVTQRHRMMLNASPGAGSPCERKALSSGSGRDVSRARSNANPKPNEKNPTVQQVLTVWRTLACAIVEGQSQQESGSPCAACGGARECT